MCKWWSSTQGGNTPGVNSGVCFSPRASDFDWGTEHRLRLGLHLPKNPSSLARPVLPTLPQHRKLCICAQDCAAFLAASVRPFSSLLQSRLQEASGDAHEPQQVILPVLKPC